MPYHPIYSTNDDAWSELNLRYQSHEILQAHEAILYNDDN